jgi:hypothetical protein
MKRIREFDIETAHMRFTLEILRRDDGRGYVGEYVGIDPKFGQILRPGSPIPMTTEAGYGKLTHHDMDTLIAECRAAIEKIDGPIEHTFSSGR